MSQRLSIAVAFAAGAAAALTLVATGWNPLKLIQEALPRETPHQRYARALETGALAHTALATEWRAAAARAVEQPIAVSLPFAETALVDPTRPLALGYAVTVKRGQHLSVEVTIETDTPGRVFVDLFEPQREGAPDRRLAASAEEGRTSLSHEARQSGVYVLRVQPELLRGGHVRVTSVPAASLRFPVSDADARSVHSGFGAPRDGRRHEGVDIFAPRGTPVVAASDGLVVRVTESNLGGRVVWLRDFSRGLTYYYAHLDEQLVRAGTRVDAGETLGTVGNTGNAKTTAPHLHFGIYARGEGAIDPDAFIRPTATSPVSPALNAATLGAWARTRGRTALRAAPSDGAAVMQTLPHASAVRVEGALGPWIRTSTREYPVAFLSSRDVVLARGDVAR
jgi:murein DD-endopeptidase MepM/ murein hydrolase activator NlpD